MFIFMLLPLLIIGLVIWAVVSYTRRSDGSQMPREDSALEILKRRYASGEISREEFEERKRGLV